MDNVKITLAYDGTDYYGWQKTKEGPSIEESLQTVLEIILQEKVTLQAASRTDRGVHAQGQVVNFFASDFEPNSFLVSANQLLPHAVRVLEAEIVHTDFHPTLDNRGKEYHYDLCYGTYEMPRHRHFSWHCPWPTLDIYAMQQAAKKLVGKRDFSPFCLNEKRGDYADCIREIYSIEVIPMPGKRLKICVVGKDFFYLMVRRLAGYLVNVGKGKQAIMTAPAHGLTLQKVFYGTAAQSSVRERSP